MPNASGWALAMVSKWQLESKGRGHLADDRAPSGGGEAGYAAPCLFPRR